MGLRTSILATLFLAPVTFAQVSTDEAASRLKARDAERQAAASRPATISQAEVDVLRQQVRALQAQLREARQQIAELKAKQVAPAPPAQVPAASGDPFVAAAGNNERLAAYLKNHPDLKPEIRGSMLSGVPRVGMTEEQLRTFGMLKEKVDSVDGKVFLFRTESTIYRISTDADGKVIEVEQ